ncbi:MAG TPA: class I SAM-dependent methyltransferase [Patescibacteria group bacterium]|nr:class I SAM-dependent methyltransferase [Patescibacteria group bacterium]
MDKKEYQKMYELEDSHFWFLAKRYFVDSVLSAHVKKIDNILDLGSGTGGMTKFLEKFGRVTGVEKNKLAVSLSKKRQVHVLNDNIQNLKLGSKKFDLVTIFDVLYHKDIKDVSNMLKNSYGFLKTNGLVLITDSAFNFLKSSHDNAVHGVRRFRLNEIEKILIENDFAILKKSYIYFFIFPIIFIKRFIFDKLIHNSSSDVSDMPNLINLLILKILYIESKLFRYLSFPVGSSILILARKK